MARRRLLSAVITAAVSLALTGVGVTSAGVAAADPGHGCSPGAHTLAPVGSHIYPETGNGGYQSLHTGVHMVYDATTNMFLAGNHVTLTDRATQCLTSFSLDFERQSQNATDGPDMIVGSVTVNGVPATFTFVQPTYPGDPNGQNDPDPRGARGVADTTPSAARTATRCPRRARRNCRTPTPPRIRSMAPSARRTSWSSRRTFRSRTARSSMSW